MSKTWETPKDSREGGEKYPNYNVMRTPSGHSWTIDDSKGSESVTFQHRTGTTFQMQHDGSIVMKTEKDKYEVTFGDGKVLITGSQDITINGGGSVKVEGDYDWTIKGKLNFTVAKDVNFLINGNWNQTIKGNMDVGVNGAQTTKVKGNTEHTTEGKSYLGSHAGMKVESTGGKTEVIAKEDAKIGSGGKTEINAGGDIHMKGTEISVAGKSYIGQEALGQKEGDKIITEGGPSEKAYAKVS